MLYMEFDKEFSEYKGTYAERYITTVRILTKAKKIKALKEFIRCTGLIEENYKPSFKHSEIAKNYRNTRSYNLSLASTTKCDPICADRTLCLTRIPPS